MVVTHECRNPTDAVRSYHLACEVPAGTMAMSDRVEASSKKLQNAMNLFARRVREPVMGDQYTIRSG